MTKKKMGIEINRDITGTVMELKISDVGYLIVKTCDNYEMNSKDDAIFHRIEEILNTNYVYILTGEETTKINPMTGLTRKEVEEFLLKKSLSNVVSVP